MILRRDGEALLVIRQPDHALLALAILDGWRPGSLENHPRRAAIRLAAREHDNGWAEEDAAAQIDDDGRPVDFVAASLDVKLRLWARGIDRLAAQDSYAAVLVAEHALTVYGQRRSDPAWAAFFAAMRSRRDSLVRGLAVAPGDVEGDYAFVNLADALSLAFCTAAAPPRAVAGHAVSLAGDVVRVTPDPFGGVPLPLRVPARRIPDRRYASAADLRAELDAARIEFVTGTAVGS
jgi:Protein of unknown function (DUF3891)